MLDGEHHQWRIEGQRHERRYGEAHHPIAGTVPCGHDRDSAGRGTPDPLEGFT
jgi:hypothetical protein